MADVLVEPATDESIRSWFDWALHDYRIARRFGPGASEDEFRDRVRRDSRFLSAAWRGGELCACGLIYGLDPVSRTAMLGVDVAPSVRRQGIGRTVAEQLSERAFTQLALRKLNFHWLVDDRQLREARQRAWFGDCIEAVLSDHEREGNISLTLLWGAIWPSWD